MAGDTWEVDLADLPAPIAMTIDAASPDLSGLPEAFIFTNDDGDIALSRKTVAVSLEDLGFVQYNDGGLYSWDQRYIPDSDNLDYEAETIEQCDIIERNVRRALSIMALPDVEVGGWPFDQDDLELVLANLPLRREEIEAEDAEDDEAEPEDDPDLCNGILNRSTGAIDHPYGSCAVHGPEF